MRKALIILVTFGLTLAGAYEMLLIDDNPSGFGYENMDYLETDLDNWGYSYTHVHNNSSTLYTSDESTLNNYDIIVWYNADRLIDADERTTLNDWVSDGNYLVITGRDSLNMDPEMAALIHSSTNGEFLSGNAFTNTQSHWITDYNYGYFVGDNINLLDTCLDHDNCNADGSPDTLAVARLLLDHLLGPTKILVTENVGAYNGVIVYWNGNNNAREWWDEYYSPKTWNMFHNCLAYMIDQTAPVNHISWGELKTKL
ncbi:MAG: hypothetical protein GF403_09235 [Candidatus Coatesbacteria bacterium]|nr:hypothetical protein [Candidatus Coatesbacteria bacterium]